MSSGAPPESRRLWLWLTAGVAAGAAGGAAVFAWLQRRIDARELREVKQRLEKKQLGSREEDFWKAATGKQSVVRSRDFRGRSSSITVSRNEGFVGLLAYDVGDPMTAEQYDRWLFDVHYHDLLANRNLEQIVLHTVNRDRKARSSSGATVENKVKFFRVAELHFKDFNAYEKYVAWFQDNVIPLDRTPAGKSAFTFFHLADRDTILRGNVM